MFTPFAPYHAVTRKKNTHFTRLAQYVARHSGQPIAFGFAAGFLICWIVTGPIFSYHTVWQEILGIVTSIITFLMVFLIQNTQNRDTEALHLKLDELLRVTKGAREDILDSEDMEEEELDAIRAEYERLAEEARNRRSGEQ